MVIKQELFKEILKKAPVGKSQIYNILNDLEIDYALSKQEGGIIICKKKWNKDI